MFFKPHRAALSSSEAVGAIGHCGWLEHFPYILQISAAVLRHNLNLDLHSKTSCTQNKK